jgi:cytochrome c oxidase cbb3-type subunit 3
MGVRVFASRVSMTRRKHTFRACRLVGATVLLSCVVLFVMTLESQEQKSVRPTSGSLQANESVAEGRQLFESRCSGCHGLDGRGGDKAPDIAATQKTQRRSGAELTQIIENGIPAGGMPAFPMLDSSAVKSLIGYLRFLQGKTRSAKLPGDPQNGKTLFSNKARCSECHMVRGQGGFVATDLSSFGRTHSVEEIRKAIVKPSSSGNRAGRATVVTMRDGQKYSGVVRNEDNFSLQLQTLDGGFHLLMKSEVDSIARNPDSLMPADYGSTLNPGEVNDLVSFLMRVADDGKPRGVSREKTGQDENDE